MRTPGRAAPRALGPHDPCAVAAYGSYATTTECVPPPIGKSPARCHAPCVAALCVGECRVVGVPVRAFARYKHGPRTTRQGACGDVRAPVFIRALHTGRPSLRAQRLLLDSWRRCLSLEPARFRCRRGQAFLRFRFQSRLQRGRRFGLSVRGGRKGGVRPAPAPCFFLQRQELRRRPDK